MRRLLPWLIPLFAGALALAIYLALRKPVRFPTRVWIECTFDDVIGQVEPVPGGRIRQDLAGQNIEATASSWFTLDWCDVHVTFPAPSEPYTWYCRIVGARRPDLGVMYRLATAESPESDRVVWLEFEAISYTDPRTGVVIKLPRPQSKR